MSRFKRIATWVLLTFVVFTAGYAVGKEVGVRRALERMPALDAAASEDRDTGHALAVWYFHGTKRCTKCNRIEAYAKEALDTLFADQVADGTISWQTANMDDVWNADALRRYELVRSSLVLVDLEDGVEQEHVVLDRAWQLTDDKETFLAFVESEVEVIVDGWTEDDVQDDEE